MNHGEGQVLSVARDSRHRFTKQIEESITLIEGFGVLGDAHAGQYAQHRFLAKRSIRMPNRRQVHLIPSELFAELRHAGYLVAPGELGENIATVGLRLEHLPLGTRLHLGDSAVVELTGIRTPCKQIDGLQRGLKQQMLRTGTAGPKYRCGVLGIIAAGGRVSPGDRVRAELPQQMHSPLPAL